MRRRKFINLTTEQDIETACKSMDRRERHWLQESTEYTDSDDDESALVFEVRSSRSQEGW
jgi:hypothetical protein